MAASLLSFFLISDVHFGHDVPHKNDTGITTSLSLNTITAGELNALPGSGATWPAALGGGPVAPPRGVVLTGDLVDNGGTEYSQWDNFTAVYGLFGGDGLLNYRMYEGRGNHDGGNTTDTIPHFVNSMIVARNQIRAIDPAFNVTSIASATGLHYSWAWPLGDTRVHFVHLNEYTGHVCDGCAPNSCFYGPACYTGWTFPEESIDFLQKVIATIVKPGEPLFVAQHYCFDGYSDTWWSQAQRAELYSTLTAPGVNTVGILCGHTHVADIYRWNGTGIGPASKPGIDIYNIPSTQKEDANGYPLPCEFMAAELSTSGGGTATFRIAQRIGPSAWGNVVANKTISLPSAGGAAAADAPRGGS